MNTTAATFKVRDISSGKVLSLISQLLGGGSSNPDPDNSMPHGPWDPYIRRILQRMGPRPELWNATNRFSFVELNPQPYPPRVSIVAALTQEVIDHSLLIKEIADTIGHTNEERSIIIVSGKVDQYFTEFDDLCPRLIWLIFGHHPSGGGDPVPHPNWGKSFSALEWLTAAAVFQQNALTCR